MKTNNHREVEYQAQKLEQHLDIVMYLVIVVGILVVILAGLRS